MLNQPPPVVTLTAAPAPVVDDNSDWPARAQATIASLSRQLEIVAQTEQAWGAFAARRDGDTPRPAALELLLGRKTLLMQQRTVLESEMVTWGAIAPAAADLADYDQQLADLDQQLTGVVPQPPSAAHEASLRSLREQRDAVATRRDAKYEELVLLQSAAQDTRDRPLPDARDLTLPLATEVIKAINDAAQQDRAWRLPW
ncbi:hypothetical protein K1T35_47720 (plasmid) [Pseudonocardia sp. DSM 110487]|uniref:hypothetical protein n=1 Tax=Pseudonocardia sp. DSM 110487 TaxID=2865833 RepID=UPI001C69D2E0|nr:hypothetical protein [Pseudonocardia sp. DSM 110487]QYN41040.1 hypothetical protein K1T35_47720 [Pseudonocardia sp. DSM 110487]